MITIQNLSKTYQLKDSKVQSLSDISLNIRPGTCFGILGTNGSGKSTLIKILCGLMAPTSGTARVLGEDPSARKRGFLKKIGAVFGHKSSLWWDLPLIESFQSQKVIYGVSDQDYERRLNEITEALGLKEVLDRPVKFMSLGERVKSEIAATLLYSPQVLFLDEPTVGLDLISKFQLRKYIRSWTRETGGIVVLTSHDMVDVEECCDQLLLLDKGVIEYQGAYAEMEKSMFHYRVLTARAVDQLLTETTRKRFQCKLYDRYPHATISSDTEEEVSAQVPSAFHFREIEALFDIGDGIDVQLRKPTLEEALRSYYQSTDRGRHV